MVRQRNTGIDLVKTVAICGVVVIHMSTGGTSGIVGTANWLVALFWGVVSRAAVPLFFMCSGALLLWPEKELPLWKLFLHNLLRIVAAMLFWAMAYKCYHLLKDGTFCAASLWQAVKEVLTFQQEFHLYYLQIILLVYVFLPVTRILTANATRRQLEYTLALWFVLGIVYPTVQEFWPFRLLSGIPAQWRMNMAYASMGYGLLGFYLRRYPLPCARYAVCSLTAGFLISFFGTWLCSAQKGALDGRFLEGMSVGVALMAVGVFDLCMHWRPGSRAAAWAAYGSRASFCIYLVHVFFFYWLAPLTGEVCSVVSVPLLSLAVLILSIGCYELLRRIPVVKRWLI